MKIGLTYDLRSDYLAEGFSKEETAEFDRPDTIEAIENTLREMGHQTERIGHIRALTNKLASGARWDMVFNIAEGMYGFGREAQVPALLDAYNIPYVFSDPLVLSLTLHKGLTKHVLKSVGIPTPDFAVVETLEDLAQVKLEYPLFAKPVAEGTSKGISGQSKIRTPEELREVCAHLLKQHQQPVLVERFLPGREFTVGIIGTGHHARALGVMEVLLLEKAEQDVYSYENKAEFEDRVKYQLANDQIAKQAAELAVKSWRALGCRDGGRVDVRCAQNGQPEFIEVNPLAGLNPEISDLPILCRLHNINYRQLLAMIMESAQKRLPNNSQRN